MFLHGGFMHLFGNMLNLWIFGNTLEDRLGHGRFGLLYGLCGLGAVLAQIALNLSSRMPIIGASAAVAGVLAASLWLFPHARIVALVTIFFWRVVEVPAMFFLIVWFLMLSGF